jgi:predicted RNase H-like HicB family nuclease
MQIPVLIERIESNGYRVTTGQPFVLTAEGATREEAMQHLRQALQNRLRTGVEIATLELPAEPHPLLRYAGMFKENPLFDTWQQAIADRRQQDEEEQESQ